MAEYDNAAPASFDAAPVDAPIKKILAREKPNPRWSTHHTNKVMTVPIKPLFGRKDKLFTIGSCFAERIRLYLTADGFEVGPPMQDVPLAPDRYRMDRLPLRPHMDYFNSFTIRQEFERHIGELSFAPDDYWVTKDIYWGGTQAYQDPYRRMIFGRTPEDLLEANRLTSAAIDRGIREASVFFMTLGMAEVFRNKKSGLMACQKPGYAGGAGEEETEFHMSSYEENFANMEKVIQIIGKVKPEARIVLTVSPVGLSRTFGGDDILVANTEGKSILRAVLGALTRKYANVTYFPSYELVMSNAPTSFRDDDGRHVNNWMVAKIVQAFKSAHFDDRDGVASQQAAE